MKRLSYKILWITTTFLTISIVLATTIFALADSHKVQCGTPEPHFFCGNISAELSKKAKLGKQVFNANCAACHKLNKHMTGPALARIDSTILWNWLTSDGSKTHTIKVKELGIEYHKLQFGETLQHDDLVHLQEYFNSQE